ncbi:hypothetical protein ACOMHN_059386 [Nucella lapillus]
MHYLSPQASSSVLHSSATSLDHHPQHSSSSGSGSCTGTGSTGIKRVHYMERARELNHLSGDSRPSSPAGGLSSPTGQHHQPTAGSWAQQQQQQQSNRSAPGSTTGLTVRGEGEDAGSHTSGSTSDSGRGGSSEDENHHHHHHHHNHGQGCVASESEKEKAADMTFDRGTLDFGVYAARSQFSVSGRLSSLLWEKKREKSNGQ